MDHAARFINEFPKMRQITVAFLSSVHIIIILLLLLLLLLLWVI